MYALLAWGSLQRPAPILSSVAQASYAEDFDAEDDAYEDDLEEESDAEDDVEDDE